MTALSLAMSGLCLAVVAFALAYGALEAWAALERWRASRAQEAHLAQLLEARCSRWDL